MKGRGGGAGRAPANQQVNVTLDVHWHLVLRQAALADGKSVPDLLRPVVLAYLKRRMKNEDLAEAVARIEKIKKNRVGTSANVAELPVNANVAELPVKQHRRSATKSAKPGRAG